MTLHLTRRQFVKTCSIAAALSSQRAVAQTQTQTAPSRDQIMGTLQAAIDLAQRDPERPVYHFHPPANWNNDPNGTLYYRGWHHLFYQFNPTAPRGGNQHWGHARSRDLVNWEHLPIALWPSLEKGERAIFSGGATLDGKGKPRLFYTSIGHPAPEQWMASPIDDELIRWEKYQRNPVLTVEAHGALQVSQWRDPFLFKDGGRTYMVCGGNINNGQGGGGSVQLYRAANEDLAQWRFLGVVFQYRDLTIYNVECPNLFRLGNKWVLLMSPQQPCEYFVGQLDIAARRFEPEVHGVLDAGTAYASNISVDQKGRTILWLWGRTNTSPDKGWNGVMVLPRMLSINQAGYLCQQPAEEFASLRGDVIEAPSADVPPGRPVQIKGLRGDSLEIQADVVMGSAAEMGFDLRCTGDAKPGISVRISRNGILSVGTSRAPIRRSLDQYSIRIFLDKRVVEVYVNNGEAALFTTVDAGPQDLDVTLLSQEPPARAGRGPAPAPGAAPARSGATAVSPRIMSLRAWPMKAASFALDRFHV
jgi:beta-fructofuranosidase